MMDIEGPRFLEALIEHEAIVGTLYQTFSENFPARETFWRELAIAEALETERRAGL